MRECNRCPECVIRCAHLDGLVLTIHHTGWESEIVMCLGEDPPLFMPLKRTGGTTWPHLDKHATIKVPERRDGVRVHVPFDIEEAFREGEQILLEVADIGLDKWMNYGFDCDA